MARLLAKFVLPALLAVVGIGSARADVATTFIGTAPSQTINTRATVADGSRTINEGPIGPFNFVVSSDTSNTGLGSTFKSFCAAYFKDVSLGQNVTYQAVALADLPDVGGSALKVNRLQRLYDLFYDRTTDAASGAAFQLAQWKILYDPNSSNLSTGNFTAAGPGLPSGIALAESWLRTINDDTLPEPAQKYTLIGLFSATAQDQIVPVTPIPAPAGLVLLAIGAAGLIARRRFAGKKTDAEATDAVA
ncbi:MAG: hypothetical protein MUF18_14535 [Fimbriiglobus sp.]|jgi:hypothetical protein|nr:hypothetical protein [Fimbriiglobus sp.]